MNYVQVLENLRKKVSTLDISEEVSDAIEPVRPRGFVSSPAKTRIQPVVANQPPAYDPNIIVSRTMQELEKARQAFQKRMVEMQKQTQAKSEQLRPQVRPFNAGQGESNVGSGFLTRPVAREDTLAHANAERDTSGFGTPRGPAGSNIGGSLLQLIDSTEGGGSYDTLFGHSQNGGAFDGVRVSEMTLAEAISFSSERGAGSYGQWVKENNPEGVLATPMGRYQIVGDTLRSAVEELGLPLDTKFDSRTQDMIASHLARRRLEGATGLPQMRRELRNEWAGFRHVNDDVLDQAIIDFMNTGSL